MMTPASGGRSGMSGILGFFEGILRFVGAMISLAVGLMVLTLLAKTGTLGPAAQAGVGLLGLPVKIVDFLINLGDAAIKGGLFS